MISWRKISALFLLAVITMPLCWFLVMELQQLYVQHEMVEKLEKENVITIVLAAGEFYWYEKNKEIIVHHKMFDVKEYKVSNGKYIFKGLFDSEETAIKKAVASSGKSNLIHTLAANLISLASYHQSNFSEPSPVTFSFLQKQFAFISFPYESFLADITGPPPKC